MSKFFLRIILILSCIISVITTSRSGSGTDMAYSAGKSSAVVLPTVWTLEIVNITQYTATAWGSLEDDGGDPVSERGICWSTTPNPVITDSHISEGSGYGSYVANITGLTPGTTYYVRAYAINSAGTAYGNELNFTSLALSTPTLTTLPAMLITMNSAWSGGNISLDGGTPVTACGVCWSTAQNPTVTDSVISNYPGIGIYNSIITGLTENTTYYVRAYATNSTGTSYGNEISFTTISVTSPVLSTTVISNITYTSASGGGNITNEGGSPVTGRGVCWSTNPAPVLTDSHTTDFQGAGSYLSIITGLSANTTYYVRAYATNSFNTSYGNELSFSTPALSAPVVSTTAISGISQTGATGGGNITNNGGSSVTARGVCWGTNPGPDTTGSHTVDGSGDGSFLSSLAGLIPGTQYYVKAYAVNDMGIAYGNEVNFTTLPVSIVLINTTQVTGITQNTAISGGNILSDGGNPVVVRGVCWSTGINPGLTNNFTVNGSGMGSYSGYLSGLLPNTVYYVRAYAITDSDTTYGAQKSFTTSQVSAPSISTIPVSGISQFSAASGGNITSSGGQTITSRGVCWGTGTSPDLADSHSSDGTGTGSYASTLTGLSDSTTYYVRAYAITSSDTAFGNEISFTTLQSSVPVVSTDVITGISYFSASCTGIVTSDGGSQVTARGLCWGTGVNPDTTGAHSSEGNGPGSFMGSMAGLTSGTQYHVRAYAVNNIGITYGNELIFTTLSQTGPTVQTISVSNITQSSALSGGNITNDGGSSVTARGVCWGTNPLPVVADSHTSETPGTGSYLSHLTGLNPFTTYYARAYAANSTDTAYGDQLIFTTPQVAFPSVNTNTITSISQVSAIGGGYVTSDGGSPVIERGVCWGTGINPDTSGNHTSDGSGTGAFLSNITGLVPNTIYFVRAYATNDTGTTYGTQQSFTTLPLSLIILFTTPVSGITQNSAVSGGNIISDGGNPVIGRGVCWGTTQSPLVTGSHTSNGSGTGSYSSFLTGLNDSTVYYVRAYAISNNDTVYGNEKSFTTTTTTTPIITTSSITNISQFSAYGGGNILSSGGNTIVSRGVCWSLSQNPDISGNHTTDGSGTGSFISVLSGLTEDTTYFVRAYAASATDIYYGNEISFSTIPVTVAVIHDPVILNIQQHTALGVGNIISDGGSAITARGLCWGTASDPDTTDSHTSNGTGAGNFMANLTGLADSTAYYAKAYAVNSEGISYSNQVIFITSALAAPAVLSISVSGITQYTATGAGNITSDGGDPVTARGLCWDTIAGPDTADNHTTDGQGTGSFTSNLTGLTANTSYYARAYATNSTGTSYGTEIQFTTLPLSAPVVSTIIPTNVTQYSALSGGNVTNDGGVAITARGICWGINPLPAITDNHTTEFPGTGSFISYITGLAPNTTYHVRAYATNSFNTSYGADESFTTPQAGFPSSVNTTEISGISQTSATCGGSVYNDEGSVITARGVCWDTTQSPTITGNHTTDGPGTGSFISSLTGLSANTTYFVRAYATNSEGTTYGNEVEFTTLPISFVLLHTIPVSGVSHNSANCGGFILNDGGETVSARGVCWDTIASLDINDNHTVNGAGTGSFSSHITGLSPGTLYYVSAYAINDNGIFYGAPRSFTTVQAAPPSIYTNQAANITQVSATSGGYIENDGGSAITARGVCWGIAPDPDTTANHTVNGTGPGSFTSLITGLIPNTTYYARAYAINSNGCYYGDQDTFLTVQATTPVLFTLQASSITQGTALTGGFISDDGGSAIVARGVCWGISQSPPPDTTGSHTSNGTGTGSYSSFLTGLMPGTTYYLRAFATNSTGTSYGDLVTFSTLAVSNPAIATLPVYNITQFTATCGGNITSDGGSAIITRGICWSTNPIPVVTDSHTSNGNGTGSYMSSLTGLSPNSEYHIRAYATTAQGTFYGNQVDFFTSPVILPVISTTNVTSVTQMGAVSGGNITSDGGSAVTSRGVCWSTNQNPVSTDFHTSNGTGTGSFSSYVMGLSPNTTYYLRAYATNSIGTAYGLQESFTTIPVKSAGMFSIDETENFTGANIEEEQENRIALYPNPTSGNVYIKGASGEMTIEILNITGEQLFITNTQSDATKINIENLHAGVYLVRVSDQKTYQVKRLIKQ